MSKDEIMHSSRRFLYGIYKKYVKRACENLGVSSDKQTQSESNTELKSNDYPKEFKKLSKRERNKANAEFASNADFMQLFAGMGVHIDQEKGGE